MKKILLFTAAILLTLASCTKNGNGTNNGGDGDGNSNITADVTSIQKFANGGIFNLNFKADCDWEITLSEGADWLMITAPEQMNGAAGEYTMEGVIDPFKSENADDVRSAQITIKAKSGDASVVIEVVQTAGENVSARELTFPKEGGEQEFSYESTTPYVPGTDGFHLSTSAGEDWVEIKEVSKPESGIGLFVYKVIVKENTTGADREAPAQACFDVSCTPITIIQKGE